LTRQSYDASSSGCANNYRARTIVINPIATR
jgi:hypothetical protein